MSGLDSTKPYSRPGASIVYITLNNVVIASRMYLAARVRRLGTPTSYHPINDAARVSVSSRAVLENAALRQQLAAYVARKQKPRIRPIDRAFWVILRHPDPVEGCASSALPHADRFLRGDPDRARSR